MADNIAVFEHAQPTFTATSRPRVVNSNIHTIDITDRFRNAASSLSAGALVKDEHFTLFESVGALEIGDPKMDSGCIGDEEPLEDGFDACKPISATEVVWLMDELLSREVAWHMGYPLSQTLFTSIYIEKLLWPDPLQLQEAQFTKDSSIQHANPLLHKLFRSYCIGLIKSCDLVLGMVTSQHYYEEEDFATQLYNRELLHRFTVSEILADMEDSIQYLRNTTIDEMVKRSLDARMQFRFSFLSMLYSHIAANGTATPIVTVHHTLLPSIQASMDLGSPIPDAFTLKIQRRLASTVPPRPMVSVDEHRTFDYLQRFVRDCENVGSVLCASHSHDLLTSYWTFSSQIPQPSVYVRALMQSWLGRDDLVAGISNEFDFILADMQFVTLAASPLNTTMHALNNGLTPNHKLAGQYLREFLTRNGRSFLNIWRTACLNRCRVRRTLCHAALEWDQIQSEAEELDDEIQRLVSETASVYPVGGVPTFSYSLSSWIYHYKLMQLRLIVQMGFELDVYAPHELASMYWYLSHLCETHLAHLERISHFVSQKEATLSQLRQKSAQQADETGHCQSSLRNLYRQFSYLKATEATALALHGLYTVLQRGGKFQQSATMYTSDKLRYELRMRPFQYLSIPEPLGFEHHHRLCRMEVKLDSEILEEAAVHIATAKRGWEEVVKGGWHALPVKQDSGDKPGSVVHDLWTDNIRDVVKASISTSIAITTVQETLTPGNSGRSTSLKADVPRKDEKDCWHAWWLVPRLSFSNAS